MIGVTEILRTDQECRLFYLTGKMLSHMGKNDYKFILSVQKLGASQNIRESQNIVYSKKKKSLQWCPQMILSNLVISAELVKLHHTPLSRLCRCTAIHPILASFLVLFSRSYYWRWHLAISPDLSPATSALLEGAAGQEPREKRDIVGGYLLDIIIIKSDFRPISLSFRFANYKTKLFTWCCNSGG